LTFLHQQHKQGRILILATGAHYSIAQAVAEHIQLFSTVIATDEHTNRVGIAKRDILHQRFTTYDYMGDSLTDIPVLEGAECPFLVAPSKQLQRKIHCPPEQTFLALERTVFTWLKVLRPQQWIKNILLFLPLILSYQLLNLSKLTEASIAFVAFCLAASAGYVLNDLLDLTADRQHPTKKDRPFAAGHLPIQYGLPFFALLLTVSLLIAGWFLSGSFLGILVLYLILTLTYSLYLKQKTIIDVLLLAGLYAQRVLAGGIATTIDISAWLLAFSIFLFTSLAFLKRYVELGLLSNQEENISSRGYKYTDRAIIANAGLTNGYLAVLVLALYINDETSHVLYHSPIFLWLICPLLLYWITRIWFLAHRQQMSDDPVQFALLDLMSWSIAFCVLGLLILAKFL
jgi:4-hydroxybenzoate polyprenyltransferase